MPSENINILHLVHKYTIGGAEMVIANLCTHASPNINNVVCSFTAPDLEFVKDRPLTSLINLDKKEGNDPRLVNKLKSIISKHEIDIVHAQGWATYIEGLFAAKLAIKKAP